MQFTCDKISISNAVAVVSKATASKSTVKALEGVYMSLSGDKLYIKGYDLDLGIETSVRVNGEEDGRIVLNARLLTEIIRKMPEGDITFKAEEDLLCLIKCGEIEYTIVGINAENYPTVPEMNDYENLTLTHPLLKSMITQTVFAASNDANKPVLNGAKFDINEGILTVIALDGFRLAIRKEKTDARGVYSFIVPTRTLVEISKLLTDKDDDFVTMNIGKKHIFFKIGDYTIFSRLIEGEFIDHRNIIAAESSTQVKISVRNFIDSLERASLLINENTVNPVRCRMSEGKLSVSCITPLGKINDTIPVKVSGNPIEIGFNNRYLLDALKASDSDEVILKIAGPLSPMKVVPLEGDEFLFLILPMRLQ